MDQNDNFHQRFRAKLLCGSFVELHANGDGSKMGKSTFKVCFPTPYMIKLNRYGELNAATCPNC